MLPSELIFSPVKRMGHV